MTLLSAKLDAYGIKGDGVTDDTAGLQRLLDNLSGDTLILDGGRFAVCDLRIPAGTTLWGNERCRFVAVPLAEGDGRPMFRVVGNCVTMYGVNAEGRRVDMSPDGYTSSWGDGEHGQGASYRPAILLKADSFIADVCSFRDIYGPAIAAKHQSDIRVTDCFSSDCGKELLYLLGDSDSLSSGVLLKGNRGERIGTGAYGPDSPNSNAVIISNCRNVEALDNSFTDVERSFFRLQNIHNLHVAGNRCSYNNSYVGGTHGGDAISSYPGLHLKDPCSDAWVMGNTFTEVGQGIAVDDSLRVSVTNNTIDATDERGPTADGIKFRGCTAIDIVGNQLQRITRTGIYSSNGRSGAVRILRNEVLGTRTVPSEAMYLTGDASNYEVQHGPESGFTNQNYLGEQHA